MIGGDIINKVKYKIIEIVPDLTDEDLKKIINEKIFKIIKIMDF